jgi:ELWxxDGT repeat protein
MPLTFERLEDRAVPSATTVGAAVRVTARGFDASSRSVAFRGQVYFTANDGHGGGVFRSDGTAAGTQLVHRFAAWDAAVPHELVVSHGSLYFNGDDGTEARGLWKSDGTGAGTTLVTNVGFGAPTPVSSPTVAPDLMDVNGTIYFLVTDATGGLELWTSDGTAAGTRRINEPGPGSGWTGVIDPTPVNGKLFFFAHDDGASWSLWKTDGTPRGTSSVGTLSLFVPTDVAAVNGSLYFTTWGEGGDIQLWKCDGRSLVSLEHFSSDVQNLAAVNGKLFFQTFDLDGLDQVWQSDGTAAGTQPVGLTSIEEAMPGSISPFQAVGVGGTFYFGDFDATNGDELWKSDGTSAGTVLLKTFAGGFGDWPPFVGSEVAVGGTLYFTASDDVHGLELWRTNGTSGGTVMVQNISPGAGGSNPGQLLDANGTLYFVADDGSHEPGLYRLGPSATGASVTAQEGQRLSAVVATFTDPDVTAAASAYTATITWGDGHTSTGTVRAVGNGTYSVSGANIYTRAGSYAVGVKVTRAGGVSVTASATATIADAPLTATASNAHGSAGKLVAFALGTLRDGNSFGAAGDFTVSINWGDGLTSAGTLTPSGTRTFTVGGGHKYASVGKYTVSVTITDRDGQKVTIRPVILVTR